MCIRDRKNTIRGERPRQIGTLRELQGETLAAEQKESRDEAEIGRAQCTNMYDDKRSKRDADNIERAGEQELANQVL
eukprot:5130693-Prorocentrum_lima.AAC.1